MEELTIIKRAMTRLGVDLVSIDEDTPAAGHVRSLWPATIEQVESAHPWRFMRRTLLLARRDETPQTGWAYAHALPADLIRGPERVRAAIDGQPIRAFERHGDSLHTNELQLWADFSVRVPLSQWPAWMAPLLDVALAAALALPVREDMQLAAQLRAQAWGRPEQGGGEGLMGQAKAADRVNEPGVGLTWADGPFLRARRGGN